MRFGCASPTEKLFKFLCGFHSQSPKGRDLLSCSSLSSAFLHCSKCRSSYFNSFSCSIFKCDLYRSQVWKLSSFCFVVCVRNVVSCQWAFTRNVTSSCHSMSFKLIVFVSVKCKTMNILWDYRRLEHKICLRYLFGKYQNRKQGQIEKFIRESAHFL